jgi:hypothetical protein
MEKNKYMKHLELLDEEPVIGISQCSGCGHIHDDSMNMVKRMTVEKGLRYDWTCSDCMRRLGLCQSCGVQIWMVSGEGWADDRICAECGGDV